MKEDGCVRRCNPGKSSRLGEERRGEERRGEEKWSDFSD